MTIKFKDVQRIAVIIFLAVVIFSLGYKVGQKDFSVNLRKNPPEFKIINQNPPANNPVDMGLFWDVWQQISQKYYDKQKLNAQLMVYGAIKGMVASLGDPYTVFLTPEENKNTKDELSGQFEGIGAQLGIKEKNIVVVAPLDGSPAFKAGLAPGDIILKVDGQDTYGWTVPQAVNKIRGKKDTKVTLNILHSSSEKPKDITIVRDTIAVNSVETKILQRTPNDKETQKLEKLLSDNKIAYLRLTRFGDDTNLEWDKAVSKIQNDYQQGKINSLIFDLRSNPGGYLSGAIYVASEFIKSGTVVKQEESNGESRIYGVNREGKLLDIPLIVLVDQGSASSAEIVSGSLQDHKRGQLVGEKTFGKGSIQETMDFSKGAGLHVTTAKWILPNGRYINDKGIEPDVKVTPDEKNPEKDPILEKAVEILNR